MACQLNATSKPFFVPGRAIIAHKSIWDCNWFQHVENSLDAVHVSFAHLWSQAGEFGSSVTASIPDLAYSETSAGIRQVATRPNNNVRISDWTFPNNNHVVAPGQTFLDHRGRDC